jgi:pimeloyl-ACP methyl ester carboxylesterase
LFVPGFVFNVELVWEWPQMAAFARRLAGFSRLIIFDRRGTGLSDHIVPRGQQLTLESRMDDIRAVMDEVGSERATLMGFEEGFALCAMFAETYPDRAAALVALAPRDSAGRTRRLRGRTTNRLGRVFRGVRRGWGTSRSRRRRTRRVAGGRGTIPSGSVTTPR